MHRVLLPQLFENMEEATLGAWLQSVGARIEVGTPLCELITEKTTLELPSEKAGVLRQIVAPPKSIVPAGFVLALVGEENEPIPDVSMENAAIVAQKGPQSELAAPTLSVPSLAVAPPSGDASRVRATPAARRAAKVAGVNLEDVAAKFPGKVLGEDDIKAFDS